MKALHVAVMRRHAGVVSELLAAGCSAVTRNARGWVPMMEAIELGDRELALQLATAEVEQMRARVKSKKAAVLALLRSELPDFSLQLKWELGSSMPGVGALVRRYAPSDTYTLWKKGGLIREYYPTITTTSSSYMRTNTHKFETRARKQMGGGGGGSGNDEGSWSGGGGGGGGGGGDGDPDSPTALETEVDVLLSSEVLQRKKLRSVDFRFKPVSGWLTKEVWEKVEGWNCRLYEAAGRLVAVSYYKMPYGLTPDMSYDDYLAATFEPDPVVESPVNPLSTKRGGSNPAKAAAKLAVAAKHQRIAAAAAAAKDEKAARVAKAAAARAAASGLRALAPAPPSATAATRGKRDAEEGGGEDVDVDAELAEHDDDGDDDGDDGGVIGGIFSGKESGSGGAQGKGRTKVRNAVPSAGLVPADDEKGQGRRAEADAVLQKHVVVAKAEAAAPPPPRALSLEGEAPAEGENEEEADGGGDDEEDKGLDGGVEQDLAELDLTALAARVAAEAEADARRRRSKDGSEADDDAADGGGVSAAAAAADGEDSSFAAGTVVSERDASLEAGSRTDAAAAAAGPSSTAAAAAVAGSSKKGGGWRSWIFERKTAGPSAAAAAAAVGGRAKSAAPAAATAGGGNSTRASATAKKSRKFTGRCWMAESFPLSLKQVVGTANKAFAKVARFMEKYGDLDMFPVKVQVPLILTVYMLLSFKKFRLIGEGPGREPAPPDDFFRLPPGYVEVRVR
ncbi:hypothetical protein VOLCADRAFT_93717 [Volvox carteri f. nagariensis]|uniref:Ankyrin repeat domain-containing protein n=1 Tax=Volvox carteri f. nagariensis TaxID=3068 RepID=D8U2V6_VOLCA|nr:uncharacterized protein VOLCADRAFT_93717 [Volvox carteri f. nagariensis]EFJ45875.1 hypothetical protein VOLCADRAFT_93717 [Volvox carteri f. nagariensis]|eukprot:XP_002952953.1 hypothetical protein VOLCADRAFT_93717 [Volvox carteri f. nagariensis]